MTDSTGDRGRRFRLTDFFLILLFLLCAAGMVFRYWGMRSGTGEELKPYELTAEWRNEDYRTVSCLREGDLLYTAAGELFGEVISVETVPALVRLREAGVLYEGRLPENTRCDVRLTVRVMGRTTGGMLLRDGAHPVNAGESYTLYADLAEIHLWIIFCPLEPVSS